VCLLRSGVHAIFLPANALPRTFPGDCMSLDHDTGEAVWTSSYEEGVYRAAELGLLLLPLTVSRRIFILLFGLSSNQILN